MRHLKRLSVLLLISLLLHDSLAKRTRKTKRTKNDEDETTPQPNVVTYSTFGFNDVGPTYDGFVPSSPDYASYLSGFGNNPETSTRLYAPAFPTAVDNSPYNMYGQQSEGHSFTSGDNQEQPSMMQQYQQSFNFMNPFENSENQFQGHDEVADKNSDDYKAQVYGAKINAKNRLKQFSQFNSSQPVFGGESYNPGESFVQDPMPTQESKPSYGESSAYSSYNMYNYAPTYPTSMVDEPKPTPSSPKNMNYKKVFEYSKYKQSFPSEVDTSKYTTEPPKPLGAYSSMTFNTNDNKFYNNFNDGTNQDEEDKPKPIGTNYLDYTINHIDNTDSKPSFKNHKLYSDYKDQFKSRPTSNYSDYSGWRNAFNKGYEYGNSNGSSSFRFDYSSKRPYKSNSNNDEVVGASSNMDLSNFKFPDIDTYSSFKKYPSFKQQASENYPSLPSMYKLQSDDNTGDDFYNQMKNYYTTTPSSASHWGAFMKNNDFSQSSTSYKNRHKRPSTYSDDTTDEIVHIPKRPHKYHIKHQSNKNSEWLSHNRPRRPSKEPSTRFKSEEDLLGLRNHDTSHPSYIPSFKINANDVEDEFEKYASDNSFKNLVEKWRQSYLKSKKEFKDTLSMSYKDHDAYGSESKPMHVPVPKPYPIEVPHPVIVPVPQPYPVRVPVPKPVAIPVFKEITVPIEKPVPYPVIKKVPYPVEKPVPVPVEKEVPYPVVKPYPVPVPHVRPVFHHTRHASSSHEDFDSEPGSFEEENYLPRPDRYESGSKNVFRYSKKPRSNRNRYRRPSSSHYYDRNRRRWPARRPTSAREQLRSKRPRSPPALTKPWQYAPSYKDYEVDDEHEGYYDYCKRSGNC